MKQDYWTYNIPLSMAGLGGGATSLSVAGGGSGLIPSLTAAEHYYDEGDDATSTPPAIIGHDITQNVSTFANANQTWSDIPVVTTSGKRLFVIVMALREPGSDNDASHWAEKFNSSDLNFELELKYNSTTTALTYRNVYAASKYNSNSIWTAIADGATSSTDDYSLRIHVIDEAPTGNFAFSGIVIDNVNNIEYFNTEGLAFSETSGQTVTSALNLAPNNSTSATKVLRIAAGNGSNIASDVLDYNKGGSEPAYTKIGEGDNGSDERHYHAYHFGNHGTQVNMTGTFGDSSTGANNGMSGLGAIIGLS
tara:strand:+ start:5548 stop:6471 length:924 start_codon:yes stop_codon:yes gene_type:complete